MNQQITLYSYSKCSTCRKAINWLDQHGFKYELKDITICPPTEEEIIKAIKQLGDRKFLFNTTGKSYRELGSKVVKSFSDPEAINALKLDGKLIKRPFLIINKTKIIVGFKEDIWSKILLI